MESGFVHLHLHSEYSLLDGACRISDIPKAAREAGQTAVAITDHGVMYGVVDFYKACKKEGVKPIIGCEVYVARRTMQDKDRMLDAHSYHLVLLVKNETGYKNLAYLSSKAFTEGFYSKPRVDLDLLREHSEGLVALSACLAGYIPRAIVSGDYDDAIEHARTLEGIFGKGNFYLELQDHGIADQQTVNAGILKISEETGIPMVATNDVHYIKKTDAEVQATLLCIQTNNVITDGRPVGFETDEFYFKSTEEMNSLFSDYKDACANTVRIAEMCDFDFVFGNTKLPAYIPEDKSAPVDYLRKLTFDGLEKRINAGHIVFTDKHPKEEYLSRIEYELSVISQMGYSEYFLIVWDFVNEAKEMKVPVGPGRGSGAGSLVAFLIGITDIDSIKFELLFERFLNPERVSMPDFDIDFCYDRRNEVINYVREKYGHDRAVQIITFGTLAAKAAVRDVGRALGMPYSDVDAVAKEIPQEKDITLKKALETSKALKEKYDSDPAVRKLIDTASALEGMPRHASTHAAGVVITDVPVTEYVPVSENGGVTVTQFGMDTIAELGLLKFDFLALRYLTIIDQADKAVKETYPDFDLSTADVSDRKTYELISSGQTDGVFQLESRGMRQMLTQLKPNSIDDIIAAIALYRPGPMDSIPKYIEGHADPARITYDIPELKPILDVTYGCIVYQEQVMQIFRTVAGYSFGHADVVRRAIAKKKTEVLVSERESFVNGAVENGIPEEKANALFDDIVSFANYAFNKSHAAAYAVLSFRTAYLKAHYPKEYYSALITSVLGSYDKIAEYTAECKRLGITVLPPDVNESRSAFSVQGDHLRYGLFSLKNVGAQFIDSLIDERNRFGRFSDFDDFISRMRKRDMNKKQLETLIKSGALDSLGAKRSQMLAVYEKVMDTTVSRADEGQFDMFSAAGSGPKLFKTDFPEIPELSAMEKLVLEKEVSGVYLSGHILDDYKLETSRLNTVNVSEIKTAFSDSEETVDLSLRDKSKVVLAGVVTGRTVKSTRNGDSMAFVTLEDRTGEIEIICFASSFESFGHLMLKNSVIAVEGNISAREEEDPKVILRSARILKTDSEMPKEEITAKQSDKPKRIFLKIPSTESKEYIRAKNFLEIFEGGTPVILYDSSSGQYLKDTILSAALDEFLIKELRQILGEENVVIK